MFWRRGRHPKETEPEPDVRDEDLDAEPEEDELDEDELDEDELAELDEEEDLEDEENLEEEDEDEDEEDLAEEAEPEDVSADLEAQAREFLADNDTWMYGANAAEVIALLDRLEDLAPDDAAVLVDAWREVPKSDREVARKAAGKLAEQDEDIERHLRLGRESVGNWVAVASEYPANLRAMDDWQRVCVQAGEAALDALTGLVLTNDLDEVDFAALVDPWTQMVAATEAEGAEGEGEAGDEAEGALGAEEAEEAAREEKFGPNSELVIDFVNRLWLLTPEQVGRLVANWQNSPKEDLERAHASLLELVAEEAEFKNQVRLAQDQLNNWLNAGAREESSAYLGRTGQGTVHKNAGPALADAVAALVVGDLLEPEEAELLYRPWFSLVGAPVLPPPAPYDEEAAPKAKAKAKPEPKGKAAPAKGKPAPPPAVVPVKPAAKAAPTAAKPTVKPAPQAQQHAKAKPKGKHKKHH